DGTASLRFDHLDLWGESFADGEARVSLHGREPRLQIEKLALRHGDASVRLSGAFGPHWKLEMDSASESFDLSDLDMAEAAKLSGPLTATARIRGVAEHPVIDLGVKFTEGMSGEADLGEGDLSLRIDGKAMALKGKVGTHAVAGEARLEGEFPYTASAT